LPSQCFGDRDLGHAHLSGGSELPGDPAYIGAFVVPPSASGSPSHLLVIAASQSGCQPLYVVRQSI